MPPFQIRELAAVADSVQRTASRLEAEEQFRKRVVDELAHRLRNKVATIQAIIGFQLRDHPKVRKEIFGRLTALSSTDELIMTAQGRGADLGAVVKSELRPYEEARVSMQGPEVFLAPKLALSAALLLHELATNAAKYGALSREGGTVHVSWSTAQDRLHLEWQETGGPAVAQEPDCHGFGSKLVKAILNSFDGRIETRFEPTGLICKVSLKLLQEPPNQIEGSDGASA